MEVIKKIGIIILIFTLILAIGNCTVFAADEDVYKRQEYAQQMRFQENQEKHTR